LYLIDLDYELPNFEVGGAFLCREIFTVESLTDIHWLVDNWIVDNEDVDCILITRCISN
jgi:hypothetical protein